MGIGFTLPFSISSGSIGYFELTQDEFSAAAANIRSLLVTNWGERVAHFHFGCNLIEFLFENRRDVEFKQMIADRITSQVNRWLPFVIMDELNIIFDVDNEEIPEHAIGVKIKFRLTGKNGDPREFFHVIEG